MKKGFIAFLVIFAAASAQQKESCCMPATATEEFASFGKDMAFVSLHEAPIPFEYKTEGGAIVEIPSPDKKAARVFEVLSKQPSKKFLFVVHEWWGLNNYIKQEAENLQKELGDVNVLALDLYDGKVADDPKTASEYVQGVKEKRAQTIIQAAMNYAGKNAKIATIGWCFGGGWSLQASLMLGKQAVGCVMYYGMPEKDLKKLKTLQSDVLGIFGTQDDYISPKVVAEFQANMKKAKKNLDVHTYDAVHAFANPSNPKYDKAKADDAHAIAVAFLKNKLK